jgi:hypothetical protein
VTHGDYIGQLIMLGVDEVIGEFTPKEDKAHEIMEPIDNEENDMIHQTKLAELENALAAPTIPTSKTWKEYQNMEDQKPRSCTTLMLSVLNPVVCFNLSLLGS